MERSPTRLSFQPYRPDDREHVAAQDWEPAATGRLFALRTEPEPTSEHPPLLFFDRSRTAPSCGDFDVSGETGRNTTFRRCGVPTPDAGHLNGLYSGWCGELSHVRRRIFTDFKNLYNRDNALNFGAALLGAGILANTKMDRNFQRWFTKHTSCGFTNEFSEFSKVFGEGKIFIPVTVTSAVLYRCWQVHSDNRTTHRPAGDFFARTARGYAVGAPTLLIGQIIFGGDRPRDGSSYWKPFQENHGISGHAFIGATPFITAAHMSKQPLVKGVFYFLSIIPAWSRVNDDAHYLSQAVLGWYLSYLSVRAVSETEGLKPLPRGLTLFPAVEKNGIGIGLLYRR